MVQGVGFIMVTGGARAALLFCPLMEEPRQRS
jgi:hypothetical protein